MRFVLNHIGNLIAVVVLTALACSSLIIGAEVGIVGIVLGIVFVLLALNRASIIYSNYRHYRTNLKQEIAPEITNWNNISFNKNEVKYPQNWKAEVVSNELGQVLTIESPLFSIIIICEVKATTDLENFKYSFKLRADSNTPGLQRNSFDTMNLSDFAGREGIQERFIVVDIYGKTIVKRVFQELDKSRCFAIYQAPEEDFETVFPAFKLVADSFIILP